MNNRVKWVVSTEYLEPRKWLRGGEFLLMCGWNFRPGKAQFHRFIDHLHSGNVAGLGFGTGFEFSKIPSQLLERADTLGFPVCEVPFELGFAQISRRATERIYGEQYANNSPSTLLKNQFINDVIEGNIQLEDIVVHVSHTLMCNSFFVCPRRGTLARALRNSSEQLLEINPASRTSRHCAESVLLELHRDESTLSKTEKVFLDEIVFASKIILNRNAALAIERTRLTADLFDEFALHDLSPEKTARRLGAFGLNTVEDHCAVAIKAPTVEARREISKAEEIVKAHSGKSLTVDRGDCLEAIWSPSSERARSELFKELNLSCVNLNIGIGEIVNGVDIRRSILQARNIVAHSRKGLFGSSETGIEELLTMMDRIAARDFVAGLLPKGISEDDFLEIETLLDSGFRIAEAAQLLGVHRHTLRAKLERFTDLTGLDLRNPEIRPKVWLALKLARLHPSEIV